MKSIETNLVLRRAKEGKKMELIFVVGAAAIVWLYFVNAAICYVVVGGGVLSIFLTAMMSKILKARKKAGVKIESLQPAPKGLVISQDPT
jgi:hypothetical protein